MKKVRLGLIGCGGMMSHHVRVLADVPNGEIVALTETSEAARDRFLGWFPALKEAPLFDDYKAMFKNVALDGVIISTPHTQHFEQASYALGKGINVLCEKPMVCSVDHAKKLIRKAKTSGKILMIGYQRHFSPAFRQARDIIASEKLGKIHTIAAMQAQDWYLGTMGMWRQEPELSGGGQLNDSGSHLVDIILWVTGLVPQEAFAYGQNFKSKVDIVTAASMKFKGGAIGTLTVVGHSPGFWEDISFWCEEGVLYVRDGKLIQVQRDKKVGVLQEDITDRLKYDGSPTRNFVDSIRGKDTPQTPPECGLRVMQLTEALWESMKTGLPAKVKV